MNDVPTYFRLLLTFGLFFLVLGLAGAAPISKYEEKYTAGLKEEASQNWSAAIQFYLEAIEQDPTKSFPRKRIDAIFQDLVQKGEPIGTLRILLPPDLEKDMDRRGIFELDEIKTEKPLSALWSYLVFGLIGMVLIGLGFFLFKRVRRQEDAEALEAFYATTKKTRIVPTSTGEQARPKNINRDSESKVVLTEKTREEMETMMTSVSSLTQEMKKPDFDAMSQEEEDELKESDIVKALASTLISEVSTKEKDGHKLSKMSLDASLVFDEHDVDFFEKEFSATSEDIENARHKKTSD